jgi:hypothetical protein
MKRALSSKERFRELRAVRRLGMNSVFDLRSLVFCPADNATGNARARIAGWLGFEIVRFRVDYHGTPNHRALVIRERDLMVHIFQRRLARRVCFHISHVPYVPFGRIRSRMRLLGRIKVSARGSSIGCAAIAELMDMKTMIARSQAGDFRPDLYPIGHFSKRDGAGHFVARSRVQHCDGFQGSGRFFFRRLGPRSEGADD